MTRTLIAYASKSGTAKEAAEKLAALIPDSVSVDLTKEKPDVSEYDAVIVGGGVRMGKMHKIATKFIAENAGQLSSLKTGYFITNSFADSVEGIFDAALPEGLKENARIYASLGGRMDIDKLKGPDKMIAKMVSGSEAATKELFNELNEARIAEFATAFA